MTVSVEKPGLLTLVQDLGRYGHQRLGVPVNGVMDEWSHRLANALVGNADDAATLECTLLGPTLYFEEDRLIALTGADMQACADGEPLPQNQAILLRNGVTLSFLQRQSGARAYIAIRGGVDTAPVLGSRSTFVRGGFGGFEGRALRQGDVLTPGAADMGYADLFDDLRYSTAAFLAVPTLPEVTSALQTNPPPLSGETLLRCLPGPQWPSFTDAAQTQFVSEPFRVSARSDRMGYRCEGPVLALTTPLEMISEPVTFGTVQVPPDGQPIVLMADRQGAGGYPKMADVITVDLPKLAQAMPGTSIRFQMVTHADAEQAYRARVQSLAHIRAAVDASMRLVRDPESA